MECSGNIIMYLFMHDSMKYKTCILILFLPHEHEAKSDNHIEIHTNNLFTSKPVLSIHKIQQLIFSGNANLTFNSNNLSI